MNIQAVKFYPNKPNNSEAYLALSQKDLISMFANEVYRWWVVSVQCESTVLLTIHGSPGIQQIFHWRVKAQFLNIVRNKVYFKKVYPISFKMIYNFPHLDQFDILTQWLIQKNVRWGINCVRTGLIHDLNPLNPGIFFGKPTPRISASPGHTGHLPNR